MYYIVLDDGEEMEKKLAIVGKDEDGTGKASAERQITEVSNQYPRGIYLVVGDGMEYASYLEARGYDVITGSLPLATEIRAQIKKMANII